jgi:hypothetical protein
MVAKGLAIAMKLSPPFPDKPVKLGYTWKMQIDFNEVMSSMFPGKVRILGNSKIPIVLKLAKVAKVGDKTLVTIGMSGAGKMLFEAQGQKTPVEIQLGANVDIDLSTGMHVAGSMHLNERIGAPSASVQIVADTVSKLRTKK